ncbi:MAG: alpha/beta fold hydrolase [Devosia sp.]
MSVPERNIRTRQGEIRLWDSAGEGLPLLLIHGSGSSKEVFAKQFRSPLAERYRMIAIDLPGHGGSSDARDPAVAYSIHGLAQTTAEVLETLGISRTAVFGWSLGGHIGIELASFSPVVAGLMLTGAPPVARGPLGMLRGFHTNWDLLLASKEHFSQRDAERFEKLCFDGNGDPSFLDNIKRADGRVRTIVFRSMMSGDGADQRQVVEQARIPIAMVNGAQEPFARLGYVASLSYASLWQERCFVIHGAGHAPFWDKPEAFNPLLQQFLQDVAAHQVARPERQARSA